MIELHALGRLSRLGIQLHLRIDAQSSLSRLKLARSGAYLRPPIRPSLAPSTRNETGRPNLLPISGHLFVMNMHACRTICAVAALLPALVFAQRSCAAAARAGAGRRPGSPSRAARRVRRPPQEPDRGRRLPAVQPKPLPPRTPFTAAEDAAAGIPGMPDARFWADSTADFNNALPSSRAPGSFSPAAARMELSAPACSAGLPHPASGPITRSLPASAPAR